MILELEGDYLDWLLGMFLLYVGEVPLQAFLEYNGKTPSMPS